MRTCHLQGEGSYDEGPGFPAGTDKGKRLRRGSRGTLENILHWDVKLITLYVKGEEVSGSVQHQVEGFKHSRSDGGPR